MTFYKELKKALYNKGEWGSVLVQRDRGNEKYCIFSPTKDICGNYGRSGWWKTEKTAKKNIGRFIGYTEYEMNLCAKEENWKIIKIYNLFFKGFSEL